MAETPQDRGRAFEREIAELMDQQPVSRSGAGVYKLDSSGHLIVVSSKWTDTESIRVDRKMLQELDDATTGMGGIGAATTPILVTGIGGLGRVVASLDLMNLLDLLRQEGGILPAASRGAQRRSEASVPGLLRDD